MGLNRKNLPDHARFGPSSMARIMACPGSVLLSEDAPPEAPSMYAAEGTVAHALAEAWLMDPDTVPSITPEMLAEAYGEGAKPAIDEEDMLKHVKVYADYCNALLDAADKYGIEAKLVDDEEHFGTADLWALIARKLYVVDYKHGAGVAVSPDNNKQALDYAGMVFIDEASGVSWDDVDEVVLVIIQPRVEGPPIKEWPTTLARVDEHVGDADTAMNTAKLASAPIEMGDHCRFCKAKPICPRLKVAEQGVLEWDPKDFDPEELGTLLAEAKVLESKIKGLFTYAEHRLEVGQAVPGWKMVAKRATRKWDVKKVEAWCKRNGKIRVMLETKLLSPAKAAKVMTDSDMKKLEPYVIKKSTGTTIAPESDKREDVNAGLGAAMTAIGNLPKT